MIEIQNVTKRYGKKVAVNQVSFTINKGEILGFLGRNGAGKTTTMNILTGYISSSEGTVTVDGYDILQNPREVKKKIGYLPEQPPLYMDMTVDEYLDFACSIKGIHKNRKQHVQEISELVKIADVHNRLIKNLSKGYKQRVGLAQALIGNPEILILDEPTVGLDPMQILEIRNLIKELGKEHTIILSSHILPEVADVCERLVIINKGEIVAQDTLANLTKGVGETSRLSVRIAGAEREILDALKTIEGVRYVETSGLREEGAYDFVLESDRQCDIRIPMFHTLSHINAPILMLKTMDLTLEDIFLQLTTEEKEVI